MVVSLPGLPAVLIAFITYNYTSPHLLDFAAFKVNSLFDIPLFLRLPFLHETSGTLCNSMCRLDFCLSLWCLETKDCSAQRVRRGRMGYRGQSHTLPRLHSICLSYERRLRDAEGASGQKNLKKNKPVSATFSVLP